MLKKKNLRYKVPMMLLMLFLGMFSLAQNSWAKDLFVATDGSDGTTRASNDISHPWRTPQMAWYNAQAGDVVYFRAGNYIISLPISTYSNGYHGTASSPITFQKYQNEVVVISANGIVDAMWEICKNYNIVKGFTINANGAARIFRVGYDATVEGFTITDCNLSGWPDGDNRTALYFGSSGAASTLKNVLVQRCKFTGPTVNAARGACIILFNVENVKILNNEMAQDNIGIYYKHANDVTNTGSEMAYNFITQCVIGISNTGNYINIHDNAIGLGCRTGIHIGEAAGYAGGDYNTINHNTLYNCLLDLSYDPQAEDPSLYGSLYNIVTNNIFMIKVEYHRYSAVAHHTNSDYNLFPAGNMMIENRTDYTLSNWQAHSNTDLHSIAGTPIFVGGASPTTISGYGLAAGSLGKNRASDGTDLGANINLVGVGPAITNPYDLNADGVVNVQDVTICVNMVLAGTKNIADLMAVVNEALK